VTPTQRDLESPSVDSRRHQAQVNDQTFSVCDNKLAPMQCKGTLISSTVTCQEAIILCESWPSWLFGLGPLQVSCSTIYIQDPFADLSAILSSSYPQVRVLHMREFDPRVDISIILLIQGSPRWLRSLFSRLEDAHKVIASVSHGSFPECPEGWRQVALNSQLGGSVIDGTWKILYRGFATPISAPISYPRTLGHVLDPMVRSIPWRQSEQMGRETGEGVLFRDAIHMDGFLPKQRPLIQVCCKQVLSPTGWAIRQLTAKELARAYDLPTRIGQSFESWSIKKLPWLSTAPVKLLQYVGQSLLGGGIIQSMNWLNVEEQRDSVKKVTGYKQSCTGKSCTEKELSGMDEHSEVNEEVWLQQFSKAVKSDDAATPTHLWNDRVWRRPHSKVQLGKFKKRYASCPLDVIRSCLLHRWRRNVLRSLLMYLQTKFGVDWCARPRDDWSEDLLKDLESGAECIMRAMGADWWEWTAGSRLFFWRWPGNHQAAARDGYPLYVIEDLPRYKRPQPQEKHPEIRKKVAEKLESVRSKKYIDKGEVLSLTSYFWVAKGDSDIRMVYDASRSGLNQALWAPNFGLPTVDMLVRGVHESTWMGDLDIGEMFLNFCLHPELRPYCGVDLKPYFPDEGEKHRSLWERWQRCMMGLKPSPYVCIKGLQLALEVVRGDRLDEKNAFKWQAVKLNLPGDEAYTPCKPRLSRLKNDSGDLAALILSYVDDMRAADGSEEDCWGAMHQVSTLLSYLGIQVASRKTRPPTQRSGAWAGSVVVTDKYGVGVKATQEKWDKAKRLVETLLEWVEAGEPMKRKELESIRGSLVYLQRTYPAITPYLKGLHLTIDSWRPGRTAEGWKIPGYNDTEAQGCSAPPDEVLPVTRLRSDILSLRRMLASNCPPVRYVRSQRLSVALYGFGDASGSGFGRTIGDAHQLKYSHGIWGRDDEGASSNFRELNNLVIALEEGMAEGYLENTELWVFTDNSTAESVFFKGHSSSPKLNDLALRLRTLEMNGKLKIQMVHIAGTRMIEQGTDGLSRGDFMEGVMTGRSILNFVPLNRSALDRQPEILNWLKSWVPFRSLIRLKIEDWYDKGHGLIGGSKDTYGVWMPTEMEEGWLIWDPPPAIADIAVEQLEESRHKRKHLNHIFVSPRLMTYCWRKKLSKICDVLFEIPPGARCFWPSCEHEPLIIGLTLRFALCSPWQVKRGTGILELEGSLREVWKTKDGHERTLLREFCLRPQRMEGM
jgi:hypothetical protein